MNNKSFELVLTPSHLWIMLGSAICSALLTVVINMAFNTQNSLQMQIELIKKAECRPSEIKMTNLTSHGSIVVCFPDGSKKAPKSPRVPNARRRGI